MILINLKIGIQENQRKIAPIDHLNLPVDI